MISFHVPEVCFGDTSIIAKQTIFIPCGKWTCLLGSSGVGKTTLLRTLAKHITGHTISYMTQQDALLPWATVFENIVLGFRLRREHFESALVQKMINDVKLNGYEKHYPHQLSGGMRKRVCLARTLLEDADFVFLDEPFGHLDIKTRDLLQQLVLEMFAGKTVIFVSHDLSDAFRFAHNILFLNGQPAVIASVEVPPSPPPRDATKQNFQASFIAHLDAMYEARI